MYHDHLKGISLLGQSYRHDPSGDASVRAPQSGGAFVSVTVTVTVTVRSHIGLNKNDKEDLRSIAFF